MDCFRWFAFGLWQEQLQPTRAGRAGAFPGRMSELCELGRLAEQLDLGKMAQLTG